MSVMEMMNLATSCGQRFRRGHNGRACISGWHNVPDQVRQRLLRQWGEVAAVIAEHEYASNPEAACVIAAAENFLLHSR